MIIHPNETLKSYEGDNIVLTSPTGGDPVTLTLKLALAMILRDFKGTLEESMRCHKLATKLYEDGIDEVKLMAEDIVLCRKALEACGYNNLIKGRIFEVLEEDL